MYSNCIKALKNAIKDGDNIYGVIKGSALNNDGASNGITAPNPVAQEDVIKEAWSQANINPETIQYVELMEQVLYWEILLR